MTTTKPTDEGGERNFDTAFPDLDETTASFLMRMAKDPPKSRPVDVLIERLSQSDGASWLVEALGSEAISSCGPASDVFVDEPATLDQLRKIKEQSRRLFRSQEKQERLEALLGYFIAVAAGIHHHGQCLSSRSADELAPIFKDLGTVLPNPYRSVVQGASSQLVKNEEGA